MIRRYVFELGASFALYLALLGASLLLLKTGYSAGPLALPLAVMPMLAGPFIAWAILRQIGRVDEMQRRIQLEAIGIAFLTTALLSMTYGFMENAGYPRLSMFAVWPVMALTWIVALALVGARYRK